MEYFLERIAKLVLSDYGEDLNLQCLVFPNRRAGLFFTKYLSGLIQKPVWMPSVMTINDLFRSLTKLKPAENEILLFELFKTYSLLTKKSGNFDDFYFWGDMLLNDFDDIDKYLVDATVLFRNVSELKDIDNQFGGLTPEQAEIIKRFWISFNPGKMTNEKNQFVSIWSILADLYNRYKMTLRSKNIAYEGMIFRDVVDSRGWENSKGFRWHNVHFIGFNALNECEKEIMSALKKEGRTRFYWDYDNTYMNAGVSNSAGYFLRKNLMLFGNDMPADWNYDTVLSGAGDKTVRKVIETSSDVAQVKLIPFLLRELPDVNTSNAHQTAVILADENLLIPVLTSLPSDITDVNVTMGYPLRETSVYSLIRSLCTMQKNSREINNMVQFAFEDVIMVIRNSLLSSRLNNKADKIIREIQENNLLFIPEGSFGDIPIMTDLLKKPSGPANFADYLKNILLSAVSVGERSDRPDEVSKQRLDDEFIYTALLSLNRLDAISSDPEISMSTETWIKLIDRILRVQSVPFSGEPLSGIQIMGILETRTLDFKNLIILSVNEGIMPSVTSASSFIPFSLREAFGLPSINHQESIYAYHFYRLLHRAENVTFVYNSNTEGLKSGEISRFLQQMKYEPTLRPVYFNLHYDIKNSFSPPESVKRSKELNNKLLSFYSTEGKRRLLSPSAINTWLGCRMKFYYRYVNDLKEPEKISEEIDPAMLGTLLHHLMKDLYSRFCGKIMTTEDIRSIGKNQDQLDRVISDEIRKEYGNGDDSYLILNELIVKNVLREYINRILETDIKTSPFKILALEKQIGFPITPDGNNDNLQITIGGIIDRVDLKDGLTRIVDYKTGSTSNSIKSVSDLFAEDRKKENDCWLQTLLYCEGYYHKYPEAPVAPSVFKIRKVPGELPADKLLLKSSKDESRIIEDYSLIRDEFIGNLKDTICKIFSIEEDFVMTHHIWSKCSVCPYRKLCKR